MEEATPAQEPSNQTGQDTTPPLNQNVTPAKPVIDVVAPPPTPATDQQPQPRQPLQEPAQQKPKAPKQPPKHGVTAAIFASVIIVLGLAALAVYAYLKSR